MRLACLTSGSESSIWARRELASRHDFVTPPDADVIVVLGGDGFLLHSIHEFMHLGRPLYGMNCGTVGFLLNELCTEGLVERISGSVTVNLSPLHVETETIDGQVRSLLAFNEMSIVRYSGQSLNLGVYIDKKNSCEKRRCQHQRPEPRLHPGQGRGWCGWCPGQDQHHWRWS